MTVRIEIFQVGSGHGCGLTMRTKALPIYSSKGWIVLQTDSYNLISWPFISAANLQCFSGWHHTFLALFYLFQFELLFQALLIIYARYYLFINEFTLPFILLTVLSASNVYFLSTNHYKLKISLSWFWNIILLIIEIYKKAVALVSANIFSHDNCNFKHLVALAMNWQMCQYDRWVTT